MARKQFILVVVRHGQATHNLENFQKKDLILTEEPDMPFMNSPLTDLGRQQANMVAKRLENTKFHFGYASDLVRAWDTAQAILSLNSSLDSVEECRLIRERNAGSFEGNREAGNAQWVVEESIPDRELLTWRMPGGESVVDLRDRVRGFINLAQTKALGMEEVEEPTFLVATHYVWMHEFYRILGEYSEKLTGVTRERKARTPNTGVDQYTINTRMGEDGLPTVEKIDFDIISCGKHLEATNGFYLSMS